MKCILDLWGYKIKLAKIIASCEGTVINSNLGLGLLCRHPGFTFEIYDQVTVYEYRNRRCRQLTSVLRNIQTTQPISAFISGMGL